MSDPTPQLIDKFKQWANGPDTELAVAPPPGITGALEPCPIPRHQQLRHGQRLPGAVRAGTGHSSTACAQTASTRRFARWWACLPSWATWWLALRW